MNRVLTLLFLLPIAGCVANVVGPTGSPLTDREIEQLAAPKIGTRGDLTCQWHHPAVGDTGAASMRHSFACLSASFQMDTLKGSVVYAREKGGRRSFRIGTRLVTERCRIERSTTGELGVLKCWAESRY